MTDRLPPATEPPPTPPLPDGTPTGPAGHLHPCGCVAPSVNTLTVSNYQRGYDAGRADERLAEYQAASNEIHDITDGPGQHAWAAFHKAWMDGVEAVQDQAREEGAAAERRRWVDAYWKSQITSSGYLPRWIRDLLDGDGDV